MAITDHTKRHDFVLLFDVTNGNPNGDPDAGNLPRVDPETMHGLVTDVALKRKVRNYVQAFSNERIFIQSATALNSLIVKGFRDAGVPLPQMRLDDEALEDWLREKEREDAEFPFTFDADGHVLMYRGESSSKRDIESALTSAMTEADDDKTFRPKLRDLADRFAAAVKNKQIGPGERTKARSQILRDYYDVRMFGAVLSTGLNAGQVRGPVQFTFARSVDPIVSLDISITRQARTTSERMLSGTTEMGRKAIVPYGLYRAHGFYNPLLADQQRGTGVSDNDLTLLWQAISNMLEFDRSAARPDMTVQGLYVFTHENPLGNEPAHRLFQRIRVSRRSGDPPRAFNDYVVVAPDDGATGGGVTFTAVVHNGESLWRPIS